MPHPPGWPTGQAGQDGAYFACITRTIPPMTARIPRAIIIHVVPSMVHLLMLG